MINDPHLFINVKGSPQYVHEGANDTLFSVHLSATFNYLCSSGGYNINILLWIPLIWYGDRIKYVVFRALIGDPFMLGSAKI